MNKEKKSIWPSVCEPFQEALEKVAKVANEPERTGWKFSVKGTIQTLEKNLYQSKHCCRISFRRLDATRRQVFKTACGIAPGRWSAQKLSNFQPKHPQFTDRSVEFDHENFVASEKH